MSVAADAVCVVADVVARRLVAPGPAVTPIWTPIAGANRPALLRDLWKRAFGGLQHGLSSSLFCSFLQMAPLASRRILRLTLPAAFSAAQEQRRSARIFVMAEARAHKVLDLVLEGLVTCRSRDDERLDDLARQRIRHTDRSSLAHCGCFRIASSISTALMVQPAEMMTSSARPPW